MSKLPRDIVDQLAMFGLIEARDGLYGFRDLAAARQVAGLLAAGTPLSVITKSLSEIRKWLPDARLSNLRLFPEFADRILVEQMQGLTDKYRPIYPRCRQTRRRRGLRRGPGGRGGRRLQRG